MDKIININEEIIKTKHKTFLFAIKLFNGNKQCAEDLTQDTLLKAISCSTQIKNMDNIQGWVYTIAKSIFINEYRKKKKKQTLFIGDSFESKITTSIVDEHDSIKNTESNVDFIMAQLKRVNPKYKKCIELHMNGNKIEEISLILNIPTGTVKSRIFMGRKEMKSKIKPILGHLDFEIRD